MDINKSQKKLNEYRRLMGVREGLSFSDYFDEKTPYEVKPPEMMRPMDEADWPIQARDLFGNGLHEDLFKKLVELIKTKLKKRNDSKRVLKEGKSGERIFILEHMMPQDTDTFKSHLAQLFQYLQKELQLKSVPKVKLLSDQKNADKVLGKTAYYDPDKKTICLYETNRHQKDILRSFAHEVIHHWQHENEKLQTFSGGGDSVKKEVRGESPPPDYDAKFSKQDPRYAQKNPWLRQMEKQAYLLGNILFRDWEDQKKAKDRKSQKTMVESISRGNNMMHISWDLGVINKSMGELGMFNFQNSSKTLCGKRVNIKNISSHHPTCPRCIETKRQLNTRPEGL